MDFNEIRELAKLMDETGLSLLEITEEGKTVKLGREFATMGQIVPMAERTPVPPVPDGEAVLSPIVGIFYASPSPNEAPFVSEGKRVARGDVLCIIEAMKLMNEIIAEQDGVITEICVQNGDIVEFGQTLFRIKEEQE